MVFFDTLEKHSYVYDILRRVVRFIFAYVFYRRFYVVNREKIPPLKTPMILVSNHQNGLLDALGILFAMPYKYTVAFLARADIFKNPKAAKFLNFLKIMPVYRQRDGGDHLEENNIIFDESAKLIGLGLPIALFPEGQHQNGHFLGPIKKGFARIAFDTAERNHFPENMLVLPLANHYSDYFSYRSELCIAFGDPIRLSDYYAQYKENPPKAMLNLADEVKIRIQNLMLNIPYPQHYQELDFLRTMVRPDLCLSMKLDQDYFPDTLKADRFLMQKIESKTPEEVDELCKKAKSYQEELHRLGVSCQEVEENYNKKFLLGNFLCLLVYAPFALYGLVFNYLPLYFGHKKAKERAEAIKNKMLQPSFEFVFSELLMTAAFYLLYTIVFWIWNHSFIVYLEFLVSLIIGKVVWLEYKRFWNKCYRQYNAYKHRNLIKDKIRLLAKDLKKMSL
ncbi:MAG: 1-acyl-sn-glycerol-3-phosphate acyltransferase [Bacteroidales bacterium]